MSTGRITIEVVQNDQVIETKEFTSDTIEVGKLSRSDLRLDDENISRRHARILIDREGRVQIEDLESTNGTRLNGMHVNKAFLSDGDEIELGVTVLRIHFDAELRRVAEHHAPSERTQLSREGFYRTEGRVVKGSRVALEGALLWEDSAIQVDCFRRAIFPVRLRAILLLLFGIGPLELWSIALISTVIFNDTAVGIGTGAAGLGLAIYFLMDIDGWRSLLSSAMATLHKGERIYVGETHDATFFLPGETVGGREYPLIVPYQSGWALNLKLSLKGDLLIDGKVFTIEKARAAGLLKGDLLPMRKGSKCRLRFGQFSMLLSYVPIPPKPKGGFISQLDFQEMAYMAMSLIIHFGLLILFVYLQPEGDIQIRRDENSLLARMVQIESIQTKEDEDEAEEEEDIDKEELLEEEETDIDLESPGLVEPEKLLVEEEAVIPVVLERDPTPEPVTEQERIERTERNRDLARNTAERLVPQEMLARVTGADLLSQPTTGVTIRTIGGGAAGAEAAGGVFADSVGSNQGGAFAGLGDMGNTQGAGGAAGSPNGGGGTLVAGLGKEARGKGKNRFGKVRFKDTTQRAVVRTGTVRTTGGGLTKEIIRRYIQRQKGSIVLCYKREVQRQPDLEGKVVVSFMISAQGRVITPSIRSSTLGNSNVENCIKRRLAMWRFPAAQSAASTRVSYPFLFRTRR
jgi:TonB family protein